VLPANQFVVTFNANGGSGTRPAPHAVARNGTVALRRNTFTRSGFVFAGWNTRADGTGTAFSNQQRIRVRSNLTLFAQWAIAGTTSDVNDANVTRDYVNRSDIAAAFRVTA